MLYPTCMDCKRETTEVGPVTWRGQLRLCALCADRHRRVSPYTWTVRAMVDRWLDHNPAWQIRR